MPSNWRFLSSAIEKQKNQEKMHNKQANLRHWDQ